MEATAVWFAGPRQVELRRELAPAPGEGEIRVQAMHSAISHGTELLVYRGQAPTDLSLDLPTLRGSFGFPVKYGYACVGRVLDVGPGVQLEPGQVVFVHHPHQSAFTVPVSLAVALPPGLPPLLGVFTANLDTAVNVALDTPLRLGETAVVFGLGTVGALIAQLLQRAGAGCLVGVDPLPLRRETARRAGIRHVLAPEANLPSAIRALAGGREADVVVEASGSPEALQTALDCLADEGTAVAVSWYGNKPVQLGLGGRFHRGRLTLRSSQVGQIDPALRARWDRRRRLDVAISLLPELHLEELISHRFPLGSAGEAYRLLDEEPGRAQQVVFEY